MIMTENVPVPVSQSTPAQISALERYGRSAGDLYGELLKFSGKNGQWTAGAQSIEIPAGTQMVAIIPEMLAGFVKWQDGELVEQAMVPVTESYDPKALRLSLGDTDQSKWPRGDDGRPEDVWKEAALLPMKNPKTGAEYTYSTSSVGGCKAVKRLVSVYAWQIKAAPETTGNHLPVVELGSRSYQHSDRKRGTIFNPVLQGVDWVPALSTVTGKDVPAVAPIQETFFADHRSESTKKRRRKSL
jgi:hypothetical protein